MCRQKSTQFNMLVFFFSSRRRHTRYWRDWSSDVCSSDLLVFFGGPLLWVLSLSIRTSQEVYITSLRLIPETPTLENYVEVLYTAQFSVFLINSLKLSVAGSLGAIDRKSVV